jgi:cysteine desulfurase
VRPGTENVPGAVGLGLAAELAERARPEAVRRWGALRARLMERARTHFPALRPTVDPADAAPHIVSLGFPRVPAEPLLHALEGRGVYVSAGSACAAKDKKPSGALRAVGVPDDVGVLRFSLSRFTTEAEIDRAAEALAQALAELR